MNDARCQPSGPLREVDGARMNQVLRHRLRNVASGIKNTMSFLSRECAGRLSAQELEYFPLISQACDALTDITNRMSLYFDAPPAGAPVRADRLLELVGEQVRRRFPMTPLELEVTPEAQAAVCPADQPLVIALGEILANACEVVPGKSVRMEGRRAEGRLEFEVTDSGRGVAPEKIPDIGLPFFTTKTQHIGLGLPIARRLLDSMGATLDLDPRGPGGLRVRVLVPIKE